MAYVFKSRLSHQWNAPKSGLNAHFSGLFLSKAPVVPRTGKAWTFHRKIKNPFGKMRVRLDSCAAMPKGDHFKMANDNNSLAYNNMELLVSYRVRSRVTERCSMENIGNWENPARTM